MTDNEITIYMAYQNTLDVATKQMRADYKALGKAIEDKVEERSRYTSENLERFHREGITT